MQRNFMKYKVLNKNSQYLYLHTLLETSKTDKPITSQTAKSTTKSQLIPIAQTLATAIQKDTGASGSPPPSPPTPNRNNSPTSSPNSSPDRMPSLRDRAVFFPQATFYGKDKTKTHAHLQSFEDFVDRQKFDPEKDFQRNTRVFSDDTSRFG